jgi:predicted outer membrane repeat protein
VNISAHCSGDLCLTLAQFAANSPSYLGNETNVSLSFLPGNHSLDGELSLSHADYFSMIKVIGSNGIVFVECGSQSGRFNISETTFAMIKDLHFVGCGGNRVSQVEQFIVEDTIFEGVEGRGTALVLNEVTAVSIVRSSFLSNTHGSNFRCKEIFRDRAILNYIYLRRDPSLAVGGALYTASGNVSIISSNFTGNTAEIGGALFAYNSSLHIIGSHYSYNRASYGGVIVTSESAITIDSSTLSENAAEIYAGVMVTYKDTFSISGSNFTNNSAIVGGVTRTYYSSFTITSSNFANNNAAKNGGVMAIFRYSSFGIISSAFVNNSAAYYGSVIYSSNSLFDITNSNYSDNSGAEYGGVMYTYRSSLNITGNTFTNNLASFDGGVMYSSLSQFIITNSSFLKNSATIGGVIFVFNRGSIIITSTTFTNNSAVRGASGVIFSSVSSLNIINCSFCANKADSYGGIMSIVESTTHITDSIFDNNFGSLYIFSSNITFSGHTRFQNGEEPRNKMTTRDAFTEPRPEGGAITSLLSTMIFAGVISLSSNQARHGGAILATESKIMMYSNTMMFNNTATVSSGGAISLQQSDLEIKGDCNISSNYARRGGGIHAVSSTVAVHEPGTLQFSNNTAENGGGVYLKVEAKLYILKSRFHEDDRHLLTFSGNHAGYGGAIYVADDTNSGACLPDSECFFQTLTIHLIKSSLQATTKTDLFFFNNTAKEQGANLFGGQLDRCIPSPFSEVHLTLRINYSGISYLGNISNINTIALDTISSLPVRVCFCDSDNEPDCSYQPPAIKGKKGEAFNVPLVVVDQLNHPVDANVIGSLTSKYGVFSEGQQTQSVDRSCRNLTFNVFSPHNSETLNLFVNGPCGSSTLSFRYLDIEFANCSCPVGFEPLNTKTKCECICDSQLSLFITNCNSTIESIVKMDTNSWITYINDTNPPGYVIHPHCPFDYCRLPTENVSMNLNLPNGADAQCAYNRNGILCGSCQEHLSLSLGSSRCIPCHSHWPAILTIILLAAIVAGILLVTALLALNMTVAVGLINGFIFYANIVAANSAVFFPSSEPSFPTVFVAWLNLDIGIDVCFFDGLDAYTKTWLQLAFPVYIVSLVIIVIIVSEYSPRFAGLIGKRDPIATLATLILLSYAKLLSVTITALSFASLDYPDGSRETVWLPDGNVKYFQGKHAALALVALLIIAVGVPYTVLLFLWQWLVRTPKWKVFKWTRNTKLNAFISVYHAPYNSKYRYWTGLLLLVRVILYITASVTVSDKPHTSLLIIIVFVGGLSLIKEITGTRVYKNSFVNIVETGLYFNLLALSAFSWYDFKADIMKQTAVAYTSTIITFFLLVGVIIYHVYLLIIKKDQPQPGEELNVYHLAEIRTTLTHTSIVLPNPLDQSQPPEANESIL